MSDAGSNILSLRRAWAMQRRAERIRVRLFAQRRQDLGGADAMGVIPTAINVTRVWQFVFRPGRFSTTITRLHHFVWNACSACLCPTKHASAYGASVPDRPGISDTPDSHPGYESGPSPSKIVK